MSQSSFTPSDMLRIADRVVSKLGRSVKPDSEAWWFEYRDPVLTITDGCDWDQFLSVSLNGSNDAGRHSRLVLRWEPTDRADIGSIDAYFHERVSRRAYERYMWRRGRTGGELDDWLSAEKEVRAICEGTYTGDWEVSPLVRNSRNGCALLKRGKWTRHLLDVAEGAGCAK
jgi:Protein of unknown function (DUF2934)